MAESKRFDFDKLVTADLVVDAVYVGGVKGDASDDPICRLMGCGNAGGFRYVGRPPDYRLVVLYSSLGDSDWPDRMDPELGRFTYYGDNKTPGHSIIEKKGNRLLEHFFSHLHGEPPRYGIPPVFIFTRGSRGREVIFRGLAVPGADGTAASEDLVAVWRTTSGQRFQNYRALFTILDVPVVRRGWIRQLLAGTTLGSDCPSAWRRWANEGIHLPLLSPRTVAHRSEREQIPGSRSGMRTIGLIYSYFKDDPHRFEQCAAELVQLMDVRFRISEVTRRAVDGGRDALGTYSIGPTPCAVRLHFSLEAKCFPLSVGVGVRDTSRLISRLRRRDFGVLVTTSYVAPQAYREVVEDGHPVLILAAADVVRILADAGYGTVESVEQWLRSRFPR